jgi:hypothetical protein
MALSPTTVDREHNKFVDVGGQTAIRVYDLSGGGGGGGGIPTSWDTMLSATDHIKAFTWADFGTNKERVTIITHTAPTTLPGTTIYQTFNYTLQSGKYRLDNITWSET